MPKLGKDVLVTFFNKNKLRNTGQNNAANDVCHWETITDNNELQDKDYDVARDQFLKGHGIQPCRDCRSNNSKEKIIMELEDMSIHLTSELDKLHNFKKSPNGDPSSKYMYYKAAIKNLRTAVEEWKLVDEVVINDLGWIKTQFRNENSPKSQNIITYPAQIAKPPNAELPPVKTGIIVRCSSESKEHLISEVEIEPRPEISILFQNGTNAIISQICFDDSTSIERASYTHESVVISQQSQPRSKRKRVPSNDDGTESSNTDEFDEDTNIYLPIDNKTAI